MGTDSTQWSVLFVLAQPKLPLHATKQPNNYGDLCKQRVRGQQQSQTLKDFGTFAKKQERAMHLIDQVLILKLWKTYLKASSFMKLNAKKTQG